MSLLYCVGDIGIKKTRKKKKIKEVAALKKVPRGILGFGGVIDSRCQSDSSKIVTKRVF